MSRWLSVFFLLTALAIGIFFFLRSKDLKETPVPTQTLQKSSEFGTATKALHWVGNVPEHGSTLPIPPLNIVINFNFDLSEKSIIEITKDGQDYTIGETTIDESKQTLRQKFSQTAPDGNYTVSYNACWPDDSCHQGEFKFKIENMLSGFIDLTGQKEVVVSMGNIAFDQPNIKISLGTKVTWVNNEPISHYINTDPHPGHNYYPDLNSRLLEKGGGYSYIFNSAGYYPYHCSAHADLMKGAIVVE